MLKSFVNNDASGSYLPVSTNATAATQDDLEASLVETPLHVPAVSSQLRLEIIAPADLPEGYKFDAVVDKDTTITVTVPPGGVEKGQTFTVPYPSSTASANVKNCNHANPNVRAQQSVSIPVGHWRDDLCDCFQYGICHPHLWTACFCSALAAGQVISRLQFTWFGTPSPSPAVSARAFQIVFIITVLHFVVMSSLWITLVILDDNDYTLPEEEWKDPTEKELWVAVAIDITKYMYLLVTVFLLYNVRRSVRSKYGIPGDETNDCCLSIWCPCLVAGQLLRHTTDYDVYPSQLCTQTGLPNSAPRIV